MLDFGKEFSIIHRYGRIFMASKMEKTGISETQMPYVAVICENPGITQEEIAEELRIDKGAVSRNIKELLDEKLITRKSPENNRRAYCIYPSEKLSGLYEYNKGLCKDFEKILAYNISGEEMDVFKKVVVQMRENVVKCVSETKKQKGENNE